jgi:endonuclease/exonuclease/phosphatase (EEP) superfamily protein YafD
MVWLAPEGWKHVRPVQHVSVPGETLTVMTMNARFGGCDPAAVAREAVACGADVVVVQEFTGALEPELDAALAEYPHRVRSARSDAYGQAIYGRRPLIAPETQAGVDGVNDHPRVSAVVRLDGCLVRISNVHLVSPISVERVLGQRLEAASLAADAKHRVADRGASGQELLLVGDFNATADGPIIGAFLDAGLFDGWAQTERGRGGTWPAQGIASHLGRFRIDNLLHSDGLACVACGVGGTTGSDHLPTWARYVRACDREPTASVGDRGKGVK